MESTPSIVLPSFCKTELCTHYVITAHFLLLLAPGNHYSASLSPDTPGPSLMHNHAERVFCDYLTSCTMNSWALILCIACVKVCFLFNIKEYNTLPLHCHIYKTPGSGKFWASLSLNTQTQGFLSHLGLPIHCLAISVFFILQMSVLHVKLKLIRPSLTNYIQARSSLYCGETLSAQPSMGHNFQMEKNLQILRPLSCR